MPHNRLAPSQAGLCLESEDDDDKSVGDQGEAETEKKTLLPSVDELLSKQIKPEFIKRSEVYQVVLLSPCSELPLSSMNLSLSLICPIQLL